MKKRKFNLFSFSMENELILYYSKRGPKNFVGFGIIKTNDLEELIHLLNTSLKKGIIEYYSIQFSNFLHFIPYIIINLQDKGKENLLKSFNIIREDVLRLCNEKSIQAEFLKDNELRSQFINIISTKLDKDTKISIKKKKCIIENNEMCQYFKLYSLKFIQDNPPESILSIFFNLINDLGTKGNLIINFNKLIQGTIIYSCFFIEYFKKIDETENLLKKIEEFISNNLILKEKVMKWNLIGNLLWRLWTLKYYLFFKKSDLISALNVFVQKEINSNTSNID